MGAYSNPETYIDTQTAQHYQRLQDTISGTFEKVANAYANRQKEIRDQLAENVKQMKANEMKAQEYEFSLYTDLAKSTVSDPSVDWAKTYEPLIQEAVKIRAGMLNGTLDDRQGSMQRLGQIQGSVDNVAKSIATMSAASETFMDNLTKGIGVQGGLASSNDPQFLSAMNVLLQKTQGSKEIYFKDNNPTKLMWRVKDIKGNTLKEFDADQLNQISKGNGIIRTIPNQIAEFDKLKSTNSSIFEVVPVKPGEKGDPLPTGRINQDFLIKDPATGKPKVIVDKTKASDGTEMTTYTQEVNLNAIRKDDNFNTTLTAQANGLLANQSSAIDFYNDIITKPKGRWGGIDFCFDPNKPLDEEGKKKFIEDYKEYYINTQIAPTQSLLKPDPDQVAFIERTPTMQETKSKGNKKEKITKSFFTESEIAAYKQRFEDLVSGSIEKIELPVKGKGKRIFEFNDGKVQEVNAKGEILNNRVTGEEFRSYLGITPKSKKVNLP